MKQILLPLALTLFITTGVLGAVSTKTEPKPQARILWMDSGANLYRLSTRKGVCRILDKAKKAGINTLMVNSKIPSGMVAYKSKIAPGMVAEIGYDRKYDQQPWVYPADYDELQTIIEEGHKRGMSVYADLWMFSDGVILNKKRWGHTVSDHPEWTNFCYDALTVNGKLTQPRIFRQDEDTSAWCLSVNPANPEVQRYELSIIDEIVSHYDVDGINLDGCRFMDFSTDFSNETRAQFERFIGQKVARWPEDIYEIKIVNNEKQIVRGPLIGKWDTFRARVIRDFVLKVSHLVHSRKPDAKLGVYVGSWYPGYEPNGVNWASRDYKPTGEKWADWVPDDFNTAGYAEYLDYICTGNYFFSVSCNELPKDTNSWNCVEGACDLANKITMGKLPVYGTLYLNDYNNNPEQFKKAVKMCMDKSRGIALFDLCYLEDWKWWPELDGLMTGNAKAPHEMTPSKREH